MHTTAHTMIQGKLDRILPVILAVGLIAYVLASWMTLRSYTTLRSTLNQYTEISQRQHKVLSDQLKQVEKTCETALEK